MKHGAIAAAALLAACAAAPSPVETAQTVASSDVPGLIRYTASKTVTAKGKRIPYAIEVHEEVLRNEAGKTDATATTFSYIRSGPADPSRPVIFVFNGGPGSSSVWQHLGFFGPRRVKLDDPVHPPITPPFALEDNPHVLLDIADIVCIDPVGTGYSRLLDPAAGPRYFSVDTDAVATANIMEAWLLRHQRWNSPKFVVGESYGATRAATLARNLMGGPLSPMGRMMGISLNGIIFLGPGLGGEGPRPKPGLIALPSAAAIAWHNKRAGEGETLDAFMARVQTFAAEEYAPALAKESLTPEEKAALAAKLSSYLGLPAAVIEKANLQVGLDTVRAELLKDKGLRLGAYDARYTLPVSDKIGPPDPVGDDPAMGQYAPAFVAGMQLYAQELGLKAERKYDAIAFETVNFKWDYTPQGRGPKTPAQSLASAMNRNADLGLFVGVGWYDFVTTYGSAKNMTETVGVPANQVTFRTYASGHMPYLGEESAEKLEQDLRAFIAAHVRR